VDWENRELPVRTQAELLTLNRSGLYYQAVSSSLQEVAFKHRIDEIYTAHCYYGSRRIAAQLHREGQLINQKTVARYMQEMGLAAVYPGPNLSKRAHQAAIFPYLLRNVTANVPNHIWGIDVRRVGASGIPARSRRGREYEPLGQWLTWRRKTKGTVACQ
jgi:putative transposase